MEPKETRERIILMKSLINDALDYYSSKSEIETFMLTNAVVLEVSSIDWKWEKALSFSEQEAYKLTVIVKFGSAEFPLIFYWECQKEEDF